MNETLIKIEKARIEFQENTFFLANWIKGNLATISRLRTLSDERGEITGMKLMIDNSLSDGEIRIGMGSGPTFSSSYI